MIINKEATVFINYAREDKAAARRLYNDLKSAGANPWFDEESLLPGQNWRTVIKSAIANNRYFISLLSTNSVNKKGVVQAEIAEALEVLREFPPSQVYVIPVRLNDCKPLHEKLNDLHWADLFPEWGRGIERICESIGLRNEIQIKFEFMELGDGIKRPLIPVNIANPRNGKYVRTLALIDTGADNTAIPSYLGKAIGHHVTSGLKKHLHTPIGSTTVHSHVVNIELFDMKGEIFCTCENMKTDFLPELAITLIGRDLLAKFILSLDYSSNVMFLKSKQELGDGN